MLTKPLSAAFLFLIAFFPGIVGAQQAPDAPIPAQILSAKKIFIAYGGVERNFLAAADKANADYQPTRTYNELYAAIKTWGQYEIVSAPADCDVVLQVSTRYLVRELAAPQLTVTIIDPRTHITLWSVTEYTQGAGRQKNREKNYEAAMAALIADLKSLVSSSTANPAK